jgi:hypothetical protein
MSTVEILQSYNKWILSIIPHQNRCISDRIVIYNSLKVFGNDKHVEEIQNFISETELLFENISFKELNTIPKFHLLLYVAINDSSNASNNLFVKDWLIYLKNNVQKNRYDFPYYCWNNSVNANQTCINYESIGSDIGKCCATINLITDFGNSRAIQLNECDLYFLKAYMLILYQKDYNLLSGNLLLRSLLYLGQKSDSIIVSAIDYIISHQNINGYFGHYFKTDFSDSEISFLLNTSFDCMNTIFEFNDDYFRLVYKIKNTLNL